LTTILEPSNAGRNWLINIFANQVVRRLESRVLLRVGVVGGTKSEPEIRQLSRFADNIEIQTIGIEDADHFLDLNLTIGIAVAEKFDLVLCSQVLEHVWNQRNAFDALFDLVAPGGILWLNAPATNRAHGSPDYFSAGFTNSYFEKNLQLVGFEVIDSGGIGTKRNYIATHSLPYWLSVNSHRFPLLCIRYNTGKFKNSMLFLRYFFILFRLQFTSKRIHNSGPYLTESWVVAKRPN
jgi:SAM-dependent methyltransferase